MITREKYLNELIQSKNNGFPKVITGIRRCGKSFLLKEIYVSYLISKGVSIDDIIILDLDDDKNAKFRDPLYLGDYIRELTLNKKMCYVFLDEIQKVYSIVNPNLTEGKHIIARKNDTETITFVDTILGLSREKNIDLYVTGSNSKMLSSDIITEFRDKATNIHLSPLSYEEFYQYRGGNKTDAIYEYILYGGMPMAVLQNEDKKRTYLRSLFDTTYLKDILDHNNLKKTESLNELCNILSECTGELLNSDKIAKTYQSVKHEKIDKQTVDKYIGYFEDAFLLNEVKRYDIKGRDEIGSLRKYYFVDTGLRNARLGFAFPDEGQLLETVVHNELVYNGYSVNVGVFESIEKDKNGHSIRKSNEIDFLARKFNKTYYIQVSTDLSDINTRTRELRPFIKLNDSIQKIIVINKPINETIDENGFTIIGINDFLLRFIK